MRDGEHIEGYLQAVQEQIRWRRVRPAISRELRQHLETSYEKCCTIL